MDGGMGKEVLFDSDPKEMLCVLAMSGMILMKEMYLE